MKFLKYIFTGWNILISLFFNVGIIVYFYRLYFFPESFFQGMPLAGSIIVLVIYGVYWAWCYESYKTKNS